MVTINQKQFNEDMKRYLEHIKKERTVSIVRKIKLLKTIRPEEKVPDMEPTQVHVEYKEPSVFRRIITWRRRLKLKELEEELSEAEKQEAEELEGEIEALEEEEAELEEMEEEVEEERETLFARLLKKLRISRTRYEEELSEAELEEQTPTFDEDVKEILRITHTWLEKLPARKLKEFKASEDFQEYKTILAKYGLIKEKLPREPIRNVPTQTTEGITTVEEAIIK